MNRKILLTLVLMTGAASAQTPPAAPAVPLPALPPEKLVTLELAKEAVQTAFDACKAGNAVVELFDLNSNIRASLGADGATPRQYELARRKAYTVLKKGIASGDFGKQVGPQARGAPPIEGDPELIVFAGGVPIKRGDVLVGAIAVSGTTGPAGDEACAQAGVDKIKGRL